LTGCLDGVYWLNNNGNYVNLTITSAPSKRLVWEFDSYC